jgi:hypothetical protein
MNVLTMDDLIDLDEVRLIKSDPDAYSGESSAIMNKM